MMAHLLMLNIDKIELMLAEKAGSLEILNPVLLGGVGLDLINKFSVC